MKMARAIARVSFPAYGLLPESDCNQPAVLCDTPGISSEIFRGPAHVEARPCGDTDDGPGRECEHIVDGGVGRVREIDNAAERIDARHDATAKRREAALAPPGRGSTHAIIEHMGDTKNTVPRRRKGSRRARCGPSSAWRPSSKSTAPTVESPRAWECRSASRSAPVVTNRSLRPTQQFRCEACVRESVRRWYGSNHARRGQWDAMATAGSTSRTGGECVGSLESMCIRVVAANTASLKPPRSRRGTSTRPRVVRHEEAPVTTEGRRCGISATPEGIVQCTRLCRYARRRLSRSIERAIDGTDNQHSRAKKPCESEDSREKSAGAWGMKSSGSGSGEKKKRE
jgi:hypothetical protein